MELKVISVTSMCCTIDLHSHIAKTFLKNKEMLTAPLNIKLRLICWNSTCDNGIISLIGQKLELHSKTRNLTYYWIDVQCHQFYYHRWDICSDLNLLEIFFIVVSCFFETGVLKTYFNVPMLNKTSYYIKQYAKKCFKD